MEPEPSRSSQEVLRPARFEFKCHVCDHVEYVIDLQQALDLGQQHQIRHGIHSTKVATALDADGSGQEV